MTELTREQENAIWDIGPEKFARKNHDRCRNFGSRESSGVAYVYMGDSIDGTGVFANNAMNICTCVRAHVAKYGLRPVVRRG